MSSALPYLSDLSPHAWLRKYHKNSLPWILAMALFYHLLSIGMLQAGSTLVTKFLPEYEPPSFPVSLSLAISSGPLEEGLFFGIPYYLGGTVYSVLIGGIIWSVSHVFSTQEFTLNSLAYANFASTIPHLFFSLRTWISGRGWFAILFHSAWNAVLVLSYCSMGFLSCSAIGSGDQLVTDILAIVLACSTVSMVYLLYKKNQISSRKFRYLMILSVCVFAVTQIVLTTKYVQVFFFNV